MSLNLKSLLANHRPFDAHEAQMHGQIVDFINRHDTLEDCLVRTNHAGHITASSWVVSTDGSKVLLLHHIAHNRWQQMGGHCDGNPNVLDVACRELEEETGLELYDVPNHVIFDVDVHPVPARTHPKYGFEPDHFHYDIRFLVFADPSLPLTLEEGAAHALKWCPLEQVLELNPELGRMVEKTKVILEGVGV